MNPKHDYTLIDGRAVSLPDALPEGVYLYQRMRTIDGRALHLDAHLAVLDEGVHTLFGRTLRLSKERVAAEVAELLHLNGYPSGGATVTLRIYADGIISYLRRENIVNDSYDLRSAVISDFLHRNLERSIGLPDLAEELGLSESHTSVLVKRLFGRPFSEYLAQRRIERACRYLSSTDLNLEETAKLCGFSSAFHLSKVFKRIKGIPPSRFRGRYRTGLLREDAE